MELITPSTAAKVTVNEIDGSEVPLGVVTRTARVPMEAAGSMEMLMGRLVAVPPAETTALTPVPLKETAVAPLTLLPLIVADIVVPWAPVPGTIDVKTGAFGAGALTFRMRLLELSAIT